MVYQKCARQPSYTAAPYIKLREPRRRRYNEYMAPPLLICLSYLWSRLNPVVCINLSPCWYGCFTILLAWLCHTKKSHTNCAGDAVSQLRSLYHFVGRTQLCSYSSCYRYLLRMRYRSRCTVATVDNDYDLDDSQRSAKGFFHGSSEH